MTVMMTLFRAKEAATQCLEQECYAACGTKQDIRLIKLSIKTGQPCLIGLDGRNTIIKPAEIADEDLSFEALYDTCYTVADLDRMADAGVTQPSELPLGVFKLAAEIDFNLCIRLHFALRAQTPLTAITVLRGLMDTDVMFRASVNEVLLQAVAEYLDDTSDLSYRVRESMADPHRPLDPPLDPDGPPWRILKLKD